MNPAIRTGLVLLGAGGVAWALAGCNDNELGKDKRRPNQPPQTLLASGPRDSTYGANYKVQLLWSGSDPDGTIDHYDFILVDHPSADDSIAASDPNYDHKVVVRIPESDDPRWIATSSNDTTIVTKADTLRVDAAPPRGGDPNEIREHNDFVRRQSHERWHTFFVRAVDNEGAVDPTPEYRSFNSRTIAPTVALKKPVDPAAKQFTGPRTIVFNWDGSDDTGEGTTIDPIAARWALVQSGLDAVGQYVGYPDTLYHLPPNLWRPWRPWDARDKSGRQAIVRNLEPYDGHGAGLYLFAVQAMDEAGAVTPVFDAHTIGKNNVAKIFVNDFIGPTLVVDEHFLGAYTFSGGAKAVRLDLAAGQPLSFRWRGDASSYGGEVVAYRYGWDIRDPSNDEEWQQGWCGTCKTAPQRSFSSGTHRFFLECRDNAETVTHAEFELVVHQVTRTRDLLLVDDTEQPQPRDEGQEDARWSRTLDSLQVRADQRGQHFEFDPARDVYDVAVEHRRLPPPITTVFDYKTIVWSVVQGVGGSAINTLANFFDPFVERNRNAVVPFNYLSVYVDNGGEFFLVGNIPAYVIFDVMESGIPPTEGQPAPDKLPVNITNWDDRLQPHPAEDSVGTRSLLWRLGVEAVDLGSGERTTGDRKRAFEQGCLALRRATPQGYDRQHFQSSAVLDHAHGLTVLTSDVETAPAGGVTYDTEAELAHSHQVVLTQADLRALARGDILTVETTTSPTPQPHTHTYVLRDQVGVWGTPARLDGDDALWQFPTNPLRVRMGVEIYNMPVFCATQQPPLEPWALPLYVYVSPTPEDPTQNPSGWPRTADGQPVVILRKAYPQYPYYSRGIAGFEPWRLRLPSMLALMDYVLLRHFRLGIPEAP